MAVRWRTRSPDARPSSDGLRLSAAASALGGRQLLEQAAAAAGSFRIASHPSVRTRRPARTAHAGLTHVPAVEEPAARREPRHLDGTPDAAGSSRSTAGAKSRTPGESMSVSARRPARRVARRSWCGVLPPRASARRSRRRASGTSRRTSDDLPTPDWPTSAATCPAHAASSASMPSPVAAETVNALVTRRRVDGELRPQRARRCRAPPC